MKSVANVDVKIRVLIVAENASAKFGGEAILPLHYYRILCNRNVPTWLVVHERTRAELETLFPDNAERIVFVPDTAMQRLLWRLGQRLPDRLASFTTGYFIRRITQLAQRRLIRKLVKTQGITVIHQPTPVAPKEPSLLYRMGAPVVIGPMNGGMDFPPAFRKMQRFPEKVVLKIGRGLAGMLNQLMPGKRDAALLLVANERTRKALPKDINPRIELFVENGVDLSVWKPRSELRVSSDVVKLIFMGRLVDWKAVDVLLIAFQKAAERASICLSIIGDGIERARLERLATDLNLMGNDGENRSGKVTFLGWMNQNDCARQLQECDVLVLSSLMECGGAVVLEAMAMEIPVIATDWGGPADYLDSTCGVLVKPTSRESFIEDFASAIVRLANSFEGRIAMGKAGREKVVQQFDWERKVDHMMKLYRDVMVVAE